MLCVRMLLQVWSVIIHISIASKDETHQTLGSVGLGSQKIDRSGERSVLL